MWVELVDAVALQELASAGTGLAPFPAGPDAGATNPIEIENAFAITAGPMIRTPHGQSRASFSTTTRTAGRPACPPSRGSRQGPRRRTATPVLRWTTP